MSEPAFVERDEARPAVIEIRPPRGGLNLDLGEIWRYRNLLLEFIKRDIAVRYKQASFGIAWAILQPALAVAIFTAVFGVFARVPSDGLPYSLFALAGMAPWIYFADAMRRSSTGLIGESELIRKVYFPRLVIPLAGVLAPLIDLLISVALVAVVMVWFGVVPSWRIVFLPGFACLAALLSLSVGLLLGPLSVRFRDVVHTLPFLTQVWMFASPIVYPSSMVPEHLRWVYSLNPMVGVIEGFRWSMLGGVSPPPWGAIFTSVAAVIVALPLGLMYFRRAERQFADII
jgi:lipopolysaccharide transport system permease protein